MALPQPTIQQAARGGLEEGALPRGFFFHAPEGLPHLRRGAELQGGGQAWKGVRQAQRRERQGQGQGQGEREREEGRY